jgi:competence protein ComEA
VPDQAPTVRQVSRDPEIETSATAAGPEPSRLDALRLAVAARLPGRAGQGLLDVSNRSFAAGLVALVVVVIVIAMKMHAHHASGYPDSYAGSAYGDGASTAAQEAPSTDGSSIVVDVGGRVRRPGLVTLPLGARVADAIRAAGGPLHRRELSRIDLAARVTDGQLLMVGVASAAGGDGSSPGTVSLSAASLEELETLPGVGPVTAQKIIDWRTAHGGFTSVSQLQQVSGIGPARYSQLSPLVTP